MALQTTPAGLIEGGDTSALPDAKDKMSLLSQDQRNHVDQLIELLLKTPKSDGK
jgi:hypothetical protein